MLVAVESGGPTGGAERVAFDTVRVLSEAGIPVVIISSASKVDEAFASLPNVTTEALDLEIQHNRFFHGGKKHMLLNLMEDRAMKERFEQVLGKYDSPNTIYHAHGFHNFFTQASLHVATSLAMKTLVTAHDFGIACPNAMQFNYETSEICPILPLSIACARTACMGGPANRLKQLRFARNWASHKLHHVPQKLDRLLAVSEYEKSILAKQLGPKVRLGLLNNPVDPASDSRQNPAASKNHIWIGRMTDEKDGLTPAQACADLNLPITFVGDGPNRHEIESANPKAVIAGWQEPEQVKDFQRKARVMILASRCYETASLVVLECLAAGIPCIVPEVSAATSWVEDGFNGLYFKAGDKDSLKAALTKLQDDDLVETMSQHAFDRYWSAPFTIGRYRNELLQIYSEALSQ
ncbi:MAG: glycosyltransferase family 4 protein [Armatimonadetes bacterium]|nr:glycosyltransferase family 4 protein [Armatimonadota bacterium]